MRLLLSLFLLVVLAGCDLLGGDDERTVTTGIYVANQGNFGDGNGSLTVYDPEAQQSATVAAGLGSIVQSVTLAGGKGYLTANTADRVDVLDLETGTRTGQIAGVVSPRYMAVDGATGYVTNLYEANFSGGMVTVLDLDAHAVRDTIHVGANPEGVVLVGNRLFVANHGFGAGSTVSVIDTATREVVQTRDVDCDGPRFLAADGDDEVWVFCTGRTLYDAEWNVIGTTPGAVRVLDAVTGALVMRMDLETGLGSAGPGQDGYHAADLDAVFVVRDDNAVLRFDTEANALVDTLGPFAGDRIGAVAADAATERLYLGRVAGFTSEGEVTIHTLDGAPAGSFLAGIAPTFIALRHDRR